MPLTEADLRELLTERSDVVPVTFDRVAAVRGRIRRRQRRQTAALATAATVVLVAAVPFVQSQRGSSTDRSATVPVPATSTTPIALTPSVAVVDGLTVTTTGPDTIAGARPFTVSVRVRNTTGSAWTGTIGVGILRILPVKQTADSLIAAMPSDPVMQNLGILLPDGYRYLDGASSPTVRTLAPGAAFTETIQLVRGYSSTVADPPIRGWVPYLTPIGSTSPHYPDPDRFPLIMVTPREPIQPPTETSLTPVAVCTGPIGQAEELSCLDGIADQLATVTTSLARGETATHDDFNRAFTAVVNSIGSYVQAPWGARIISTADGDETVATTPVEALVEIGESQATLYACFVGSTVVVAREPCTP
jgi:hypothetical protein